MTEVLYHQKKIIELLWSYIEQKDVHSLESLLDLVTHFAHDLGPDFEPYFEKSLTILIDLAHHVELEVVEWSFNCMAYLFKYLSRLITTNLKPTFDVLAPLFGRETHQKHYVLRFAAESMAFLLRKCSSDSFKDIALHIIQDVSRSSNIEYLLSVATLFSDAMKNPGTALHSKTEPMLTELFRICVSHEKYTDELMHPLEVAINVFYRLVQHSDKESAKVLTKVTYAVIDNAETDTERVLGARLIVGLSGIWKGTKVNDWQQIFQHLMSLLGYQDTNSYLLQAILTTLQNADFQSQTKCLPDLIRVVVDHPYIDTIHFFDAYLMLNKASFTNHGLLAVRDTVKNQGSTQFQEVCMLLMGLHRNGLLSKVPLGTSVLCISGVSSFSSQVQRALVGESQIDLWVALEMYLIALEPTKSDKINIKRVFDTTLDSDQDLYKPTVLGKLLSVMASARIPVDFGRMCTFITMSNMASCLVFMQGVRDAIVSSTPNDEEKLTLARSLWPCIGSTSHDIRQTVLEIFHSLYPSSSLIDECLAIESMSLTMTNSRSIMISIRRLGTDFASHGSEDIIDNVVVQFLWALLTVRFQPIWETTMESIKIVASKGKVVQNLIWELARGWIDTQNATPAFEGHVAVGAKEQITLEFEDHALSKSMAIIVELQGRYDDPKAAVDGILVETMAPAEIPQFLRTHALKVLQRLPKLAESQVDELVPFLLHDLADAEEFDHKTWSNDDRVALLELFALMTNLKSAREQERVHLQFLDLLANRNVAVQRLALQSVLVFERPARKYREQLENLLDDSIFRDQLSKFVLNPDEEGSTLAREDQNIVLPVVVRILFGKLQTAKKTGTKSASRFAIVNSLGSLDPMYLRMFVSIAAERLDHTGFFSEMGDKFIINPSFANNPSRWLKREAAFTATLEDLIGALRDKCAMAFDIIMESLSVAMFRGYNDQSSNAMEVDDDAELDEAVENNGESQQKMSKAIRQTGMKCLNALFKYISDTTIWERYFEIVYMSFIKPRLARLSAEVVQGPMRVIVTFSANEGLAQYLSYDNSAMLVTLFRLVDCHEVSDAVIDILMDTLLNLFRLPVEYQVRNSLLKCVMPIILPKMPFILSKEVIPPALLEKEAEVLSELVQLQIIDNETRTSLIRVCLAAVTRPSQIIRTPVKISLLKAMPSLFDDDSIGDELVIKSFEELARIFRQIPQRDVREGLANLYNLLGKKLPVLERVGGLLVELNSYSNKRIGLPDFDRRMPAFAEITENLYSSLTGLEWVPLLNCMLFFMKDTEEHALRTNAAYTVKRFIDSIAKQADKEKHLKVVEEILIPIIKHNLRDTNKMFRDEFIEVLHELVASGSFEPLNDLQALLLDEESNIFINLTHLQTHRQARAIRRLGQIVEQDKVTSYNIFHYLLPIVEHDVDAEYGGDVIRTMSQMASRLSWTHYRNYLRKFVHGLKDNEKLKMSVRLIDAMADALYGESATKQSEDEQMMGAQSQTPGCKLAVNQEDLTEFLLKQVIGPASSVLQRRNEDNSLPKRLPLAVSLVKFLTMLPDELVRIKVPGVLTSVCQILRTKAVELRDEVRKVLGKIAIVLGPTYLRTIVWELKGALFKGLQLHILGYTLHSLLVSVKNTLGPGDLNGSARLISEIIMEDTFGRVGAAKDDEDYKSEVREVKQFKSFDSAEILAKFVSLDSFSELMFPVRDLLLTQKMTMKKEHKIEEFLRRVSVGMFQNQGADSQSVLVMCYQIFADVQKEQSAAKATAEYDSSLTGQQRAVKEQKSNQEDHFTVVLDSRHFGQNHFPANLHQLSKFALETVRSVMHKNEEVCTPENVLGLVPILEQTIKDRNESIQVSTLRLLNLFVTKHPRIVADKMEYFGDHVLEFVRNNINTHTPICQASLKLLALMLRKSQAIGETATDIQVLSDESLAYVLTRIKSDLEEPEMQSVAAGIVKAVLARKLMIPEVYDVMEHVAQVMVTNHVKATRDSCRSTYIQFLTNYPQGEKRIKKELKFLTGNLSYSAPTGRLSVMEVIHELVTKISAPTIEESYLTFFVALVLVLVNDDSTECREAAATLIEEILDHESQIAGIESYLLKWLNVGTNETVLRGAYQVCGIYLEKCPTKNKSVHDAITRMVLYTLGNSRAEAVDKIEVSWQTVYMALQLLMKSTAQIGMDSNFIKCTVDCVLYPHPWVRLAASRLLGTYFSHDVDTDLEIASFRLFRQLGAPDLDQDLAVQTTKNLVYILRQWIKENRLGQDSEKEVAVEENEDTGASRKDVQWMVKRCSLLMRDEKFTAMAKKASIQILASIVQLVPEPDSLVPLAHDIIEALFYYSTTQIEKFTDLRDLCVEALGMVQKKIGVTPYVAEYSKVQQEFADRRQERKQKRAIEAINDPELHAKKKQKKNEHKRQKRREEINQKRFKQRA